MTHYIFGHVTCRITIISDGRLQTPRHPRFRFDCTWNTLCIGLDISYYSFCIVCKKLPLSNLITCTNYNITTLLKEVQTKQSCNLVLNIESNIVGYDAIQSSLTNVVCDEEDITWLRGDTNFWKYLSLIPCTLKEKLSAWEDKIRIPKWPCNVLFIL